HGASRGQRARTPITCNPGSQSSWHSLRRRRWQCRCLLGRNHRRRCRAQHSRCRYPVRRNDLPSVTTALESVGFVATKFVEVVIFRDGEEGKPTEAIYLVFSGERTTPHHLLFAPKIQTIDDFASYRVLSLESLVLMLLDWNRNIDSTHIRDL